jgi:hypothetical protein
MLEGHWKEHTRKIGNMLELASLPERRVVREEVKPDRVVSHHDGVEHTGSHEPRCILCRPMRRAEDRPKPFLLLLLLKELDHPAGAPHVSARARYIDRLRTEHARKAEVAHSAANVALVRDVDLEMHEAAARIENVVFHEELVKFLDPRNRT